MMAESSGYASNTSHFGAMPAFHFPPGTPLGVTYPPSRTRNPDAKPPRDLEEEESDDDPAIAASFARLARANLDPDSSTASPERGPASKPASAVRIPAGTRIPVVKARHEAHALTADAGHRF
jgi:hypothetical protein